MKRIDLLGNNNQCVCGTGNQPQIPLKKEVAVGADEWVVLQFYRLVTGKRVTGNTSQNQWDCTNADWKRHWTGATELFCLNDFQSVIQATPTAVQLVDPQTAATLFSDHAL